MHEHRHLLRYAASAQLINLFGYLIFTLLVLFVPTGRNNDSNLQIYVGCTGMAFAAYSVVSLVTKFIPGVRINLAAHQDVKLLTEVQAHLCAQAAADTCYQSNDLLLRMNQINVARDIIRQDAQLMPEHIGGVPLAPGTAAQMGVLLLSVAGVSLRLVAA
jgi:hypothetical protein